MMQHVGCACTIGAAREHAVQQRHKSQLADLMVITALNRMQHQLSAEQLTNKARLILIVLLSYACMRMCAGAK